MSGPGASQQHNSYCKVQLTTNNPGHVSSQHQYYHYYRYHRCCSGHVESAHPQPQPPLPIERVRPSPGDQQEALRKDEVEHGRSSTDYPMNDTILKDMSDNSSADGGRTEDVMKLQAPVTDVQPTGVVHGGRAWDSSSAKCHGGHKQGSSSNKPHGGVSNRDEYSASQVSHDGCNIPCRIGQYSTEVSFPPSQTTKMKTFWGAGFDFIGGTDDSDKRDSGTAKKQYDETLIANLLELNASANSKIADLTTRMNDYKSTADRLTEQFSRLEQSNSKSVGGTGAHKDSHAIPPNLVQSVIVVNEAAIACTKTFITFLKERKALNSHVAWKSAPVGADDRYRKFAVEAYICSRLFAGFENDSYVDSSDCLQSSQYLPANHEENEFFLQIQDLELRHQQYLLEYDQIQKLGLQGIMERMKSSKAGRNDPFVKFCCRKLVNIVQSGFKEFVHDEDYSKHSLLHQLATNQKFCDKFLKPFVNLAMVTFLLHRLAFQFNPPARIFRYARGTKFDPTYMESVVPIDDDDSDKAFDVGLMLVPGFQVGATIIKCTVYLVPHIVTPGSNHANLEQR